MEKAALGAMAICLLTLTGCASIFGSGNKAVAEMLPAPGRETRGIVQFEQRENRVMMLVDLAGLPPNHVHGFLLYQKGGCQVLEGDVMASAATGKFMLPHLRADSRGVAKVSFEIDGITLKPGTDSIIGWSLLAYDTPVIDMQRVLENTQLWLGCGVVRVP